MPIHRTPPKETLKQLGQILERSQDSLCWGLVEDLGLSYFDLKYHQVEESLNIIQSAQDQSLAHRIRLTTAAAWVDGPDVLRSIFRTLAAAIAAGNEEVWIGLPEQSHHTAQLLQLLLHPLDLGIRIVPSDVEPFIESCLGQVHTLLIQGQPRWMSGWQDVFSRWGMRVHFEGPANDAILVFEGADPEISAQWVLQAALRNSGQDPNAPHRIYVSHRILAAFTNALMNHRRNFPLGNPHDPKSRLGPIAETALQKLSKRLTAAYQSGAKIQCGGQPKICTPDGRLGLEPTILTSCRTDMALVQEPCPAPVLALLGFDDPREGIRQANLPRGGQAVSLLSPPPYARGELSAYFGRVFIDTTPFRRHGAQARLRWGSDPTTSWIWEPMADGRLAKRGGAHCLIRSFTPKEARINLPGVISPTQQMRAVQGFAGPDGVVFLPG